MLFGANATPYPKHMTASYCILNMISAISILPHLGSLVMTRAAERGAGWQIAPGPQAPRGLIITPNASRSGGPHKANQLRLRGASSLSFAPGPQIPLGGPGNDCRYLVNTAKRDLSEYKTLILLLTICLSLGRDVIVESTRLFTITSRLRRSAVSSTP